MVIKVRWYIQKRHFFCFAERLRRSWRPSACSRWLSPADISKVGGARVITVEGVGARFNATSPLSRGALLWLVDTEELRLEACDEWFLLRVWGTLLFLLFSPRVSRTLSLSRVSKQAGMIPRTDEREPLLRRFRPFPRFLPRFWVVTESTGIRREDSCWIARRAQCNFPACIGIFMLFTLSWS